MREVRQFFNGVVENVFYSDLGVCNPEPVEYFSELLSSYVHVDDLFPFGENRKVVSIDRLFERATSKESKRQLCRYIGDFTIFWTGLYPENIKNLASTGLGFSKRDFANRGQEFYLRAARLSTDKQKPPHHLLKNISNHYDDYMQGLSLCRQEFC